MIILTPNNEKSGERQLKRSFETCSIEESGRKSGEQWCLRTEDALNANGFLRLKEMEPFERV